MLQQRFTTLAAIIKRNDLARFKAIGGQGHPIDNAISAFISAIGVLQIDFPGKRLPLPGQRAAVPAGAEQDNLHAYDKHVSVVVARRLARSRSSGGRTEVVEKHDSFVVVEKIGEARDQTRTTRRKLTPIRG